VSTITELRHFRWRYFRRNPIGYLEWHAGQYLETLLDCLHHVSEQLGVKRPLKRVYRRLLGDPVL
jgi:hypothetical protein